MKKWAVLLLMPISFWSCNNETTFDADYRDGFIGTYVGVRTSSSWMLGEPSSSSSATDTVLVSAVGDSLLKIDQTEILIGEDGLFFEQGGGSTSSYFSVTFTSDSLHTNMNGGGLGGGYHSAFRGRKQ
jgi:hypothetical protein